MLVSTKTLNAVIPLTMKVIMADKINATPANLARRCFRVSSEIILVDVNPATRPRTPNISEMIINVRLTMSPAGNIVMGCT